MDVQQSAYAQGDWIVHAYYGVGQVKEMEKKELEGEKQTFHRVETFDGEYWLSVSGTGVEYIRPIASEYQIKRALTLVRTTPEELPENHTQRGRVIHEAIRDPSLYTKARMIRDLHAREQEARLNFSEEDALSKMKKQFLDEWSVIKDMDREVLEEKLDEALNTSN
jgi:RNA polymerase-interacting CarD/CdnL/TRCF family regulator